jgi:hypothetical protein
VLPGESCQGQSRATGPRLNTLNTIEELLLLIASDSSHRGAQKLTVENLKVELGVVLYQNTE